MGKSKNVQFYFANIDEYAYVNVARCSQDSPPMKLYLITGNLLGNDVSSFQGPKFPQSSSYTDSVRPHTLSKERPTNNSVSLPALNAMRSS